MGRPAKIKYRDGEITIKGLDPLDTDLVKNVIREAEPRWHPFEEGFKVENLVHEGYTAVKDKGKYFLVTMKFNLDKKEIMITDTKEFSSWSVLEFELKKLLGTKTFALLKKN